jgi:hypothetical protein
MQFGINQRRQPAERAFLAAVPRFEQASYLVRGQAHGPDLA